jgi:hypothetical protein
MSHSWTTGDGSQFILHTPPAECIGEIVYPITIVNGPLLRYDQQTFVRSTTHASLCPHMHLCVHTCISVSTLNPSPCLLHLLYWDETNSHAQLPFLPSLPLLLQLSIYINVSRQFDTPESTIDLCCDSSALAWSSDFKSQREVLCRFSGREAPGIRGR